MYGFRRCFRQTLLSWVLSRKDYPLLRYYRRIELNELLAATKGASNRLINAQDFSEEEIRLIHQFYCLLAEKAKRDSDLGETHWVEEAEDHYHKKLAAYRG